MALTFIDTNKLSKNTTPGHGEFIEVLNQALCGARNVHGSVRWLKSGESFEPAAVDRHQLIYLMDGKGSIKLDSGSYDVEQGAGVYLGPAETAAIKPAAGGSLKLFHLVVPRIPK
jgi:AraC-like ligand binding domain